MADIKTFEDNTFSVLITWRLADGTPKDLTGATVVATASNGATLAGSVSDGAAGQVRISGASGIFLQGIHEVQAKVTKDGVTRTFSATVAVKNSLAA